MTTPRNSPLLASVGDLVEDLVVEIAGPVNVASDVEARITRRRGGSAATVAAVAATIAGQARFVGCVGDDPLGDSLLALLRDAAVEPAVARRGRTGTVVALVDPSGERSMLTDRGSSADLADPDPAWLDGVDVVHVPWYSLAVEPLAASATQLLRWARDRSITTSIDLSSVSVLEAAGRPRILETLARLRPDVVLANADEAAFLGDDGTGSVGVATGLGALVVKRGPRPATVTTGDSTIEIPARPLPNGIDTTGAGDAFAAGFLLSFVAHGAGVEALTAGHEAAADHLIRRAV